MQSHREKGFTLVEILLVLTIVSAVLYMALGYFQQKALQMRIDRTTTQMQQILNAGLSYYVATGEWPVSNGSAVNITTQTNNNLQLSGYLPASISIASPFGGSAYYIYSDSQGRAFTVYTNITSGGRAGAMQAGAIANVIAGTLPVAYTSTGAANPPPVGVSCATNTTNCWIVTSVNIPGQNINNARAVNFTGIVRPGGCVPVPVCPVDAAGNTMIPQVQVIPVSVSGLNDPASNAVYPISSFTAYATGPALQPAACTSSTSAPQCSTSYQGGQPATSYWRACIQVITGKGNIQLNPVTNANQNNNNMGNIELMAITRCQVNNETGTSATNIYSN
jgi:prepilin-type N-terminal cleavage/methylation domain-containing protein